MRLCALHPRLLATAALAAGLIATAAGCQPSNPNAADVEPPVVTQDAPQSSEEAAAQAEPPPIQYKGRAR